MIVLWNYFVAEPSSIDIALFVCESFMQIMSSYSMGLVHSDLDMPTSEVKSWEQVKRKVS
jgi:hypothetical protein